VKPFVPNKLYENAQKQTSFSSVIDRLDCLAVSGIAGIPEVCARGSGGSAEAVGVPWVWLGYHHGELVS
jgi:hypothetical protein